MATTNKTPQATGKTATVKSPAAPRRAPAKAAKPAVKPPVKVLAKAPLKAPVKAKQSPKALSPAKPTQAVGSKPVKVEKIKKPKMIRDSFTIPKPEYVVLDALKERAGKLSRAAKKSELLRAGIKALAAMPDAAFLAALSAVPTLKTGRPAATN
jgi:hypothetical protein